jgi:integrase
MRLHVYKRHNTYWVRYTLDRKQYRRSLGVEDPTLARRIARQLEKDIILGVNEVPDERSLFSDFRARYEEHAKAHKRPRTVATEQWALDLLVKHQPIHLLQNLTPTKVEALKANLIRTGLSRASINVALNHLSAIFATAVKWRLLSKNPLSNVSKMKTEKALPRFVTGPQINRLLDAARGHSRDLYLVFLLGIYAGLRKNEIGHARWEWFDFERKTITLSPHEGFHIKDSDCRTIPLHHRIIEALLPERQDEGYIFFPERTSYKGFYRYEFKKNFALICKQADLEWVTPHVLRHTFASQLAIAGVSLYKISQWLGHSKFSTTQIYAHLQASDEEINLI